MEKIAVTPEVAWDLLVTELVKEEKYEKLALLKRAKEGELLGKTVLIKGFFSSKRFVHCAAIAFLKVYDVNVQCNLCKGKKEC